MGLDCDAARAPEGGLTEEDLQAFREARVLLCECDGGASFRGEVYDLVVLETTGVSLRQEWIPPEILRRLAAELERAQPEQATALDTRCSPAEVVELGRFLRLCTDRGLGLTGSF